MDATATNGDAWTGEKHQEWWIYRDKDGHLYESKEVPAYRISMNNATQRTIKGKRTISAIS